MTKASKARGDCYIISDEMALNHFKYRWHLWELTNCMREVSKKMLGYVHFPISTADWSKKPTKVWLLKPTGFAWNLVKQVVALLQISVPAKLNTISSGIPGMKKFWGLFPPARREKAIQKTDRPVFSFWEVEKLQWFQESHCNLCQLRIC